MDQNFKNIIGRFLPAEKIKSCTSFGEGHIHDTYLVETIDHHPDYILQKINHHVFRNIPV